MTAAWAVAAAGVFVWLGMVLAISFLEAPLKFRAPGITVPLGLGIGRLVFRALNTAELLLGLAVLVALSIKAPPAPVVVAILTAVAALMIQVFAVRRWLNRRSDEVLAGAEGPRSRGHYVYIALEVVKVIALLTTGALLLGA
ncbi:hypothetical protein [Mycobacterium sp.]|uniref:hypothetical protein n=1 Tax=Mycobacterium sp. TaxID=1785 RepID=UPI002D643DA1|nr:hypothetical protein [Mycobacterium sp.]HZA10229.1 hypothetical protein [Mycobacterium sp.]